MFPPYKAFKKQKSRDMTQFPGETNSMHVCSPWTCSHLYHLANVEMVLTSRPSIDNTAVENQLLSLWHSWRLSHYSCRLAEQQAPETSSLCLSDAGITGTCHCTQLFLWVLRIHVKVPMLAQQALYWPSHLLLHFNICCANTNLNACFLTPQPMVFSLPPLSLAPPGLSLIRTPHFYNSRNAQLFSSIEWGLSRIPPRLSHWLGYGQQTFGSWRDIPTMFLTMVAAVYVVLHVSWSFMILCLWENAVTILRLAVLTYS